MAFFEGVMRSQVMSMNTHLNFCLPDEEPAKGSMILLHGLSGDCSDWGRSSCIDRYARERALAVFMPEVQRSWYTDMVYGLPYFTFISEELPRWIAERFCLPTDGEHLYVGGLSMGGYGAMKCALTHPERYAGAVCLSSRFYLDRKVEGLTNPADKGEWMAILGESGKIPPEGDLERLAAQVDPKAAPRMYIACGTEDGLYPESVRMRDCLRGRGFALEYEEWSGIHDWYFWDAGIKRGLDAVVR